jgi:hypothetical protein
MKKSTLHSLHTSEPCAKHSNLRNLFIYFRSTTKTPSRCKLEGLGSDNRRMASNFHRVTSTRSQRARYFPEATIEFRLGYETLDHDLLFNLRLRVLSSMLGMSVRIVLRHRRDRRSRSRLTTIGRCVAFPFVKSSVRRLALLAAILSSLAPHAY